MNEPEASNADWLHAAHQRHGPALSRYAASIVGDADRARDVVQDVFLRLWRKTPPGSTAVWSSGSSPSAAIARWTCIGRNAA